MGYSSTKLRSYPFMERQDLTQGQLGSFKFTPVDGIGNTDNHETFASLAPQLAQQLEQNAFETVMARVANYQGNAFPKDVKSEPHLLSPVNLRTSHSTPDSSFFNNHIKQDLAESRLRLGPAALRSAVESAAASPPKLLSARQAFVNDKSFVAPFRHHQRGSSDMNPSASSFTPGTNNLDHDFDDASAINQSLCRALALEQETHHATQFALNEAQNKVKILQAEVENLSKQNNSLVSTVNMLGSIIKHNTEQSKNEPQPEPELKQIRLMAASAEKNLSISNGSILYDVLAAQKATYQEKENKSSPISTHECSDFVPQENGESQQVNNKIFNFDSLKNPDQLQHCSVDLSHTLRKHFMLDSDDVEQEKTFKHSLEHNDNKDTYVSALHQEGQLVSLHDPGSKLIVNGQKPRTSSSNTMEDLANRMNGLKTSENPTLELPTSFLAKYQKQASDDLRAEFDEVLHEPEAVKPSLNLGNADEEFKRDNKLRQPLERTALLKPSEVNPKWHITIENRIYDTASACEAARRMQTGSKTIDVFWRYPVRYLEYMENNLFRTVMIDFIPVESTYKDIVSQICEGSLESIQLLGPINKTTDFMTARVVFNYELSAARMVAHARDQGVEIKGAAVRVWQVKTQTYPKSEQLDEDVFTNGYTRLLLIDNVNDEILSTLENKLTTLKRQIIEIGKAHDGVPMVEFTSVAAAAKALRKLVTDPEFGGGVFDFEEDPCAEPY